jgi:hypothetical protein
MSAPSVLLEFGARSTGEPNEPRPVACDAAPHQPDVSFPSATPQVMRPERTFWEKATAIHVFCAQGSFRGGDALRAPLARRDAARRRRLRRQRREGPRAGARRGRAQEHLLRRIDARRCAHRLPRSGNVLLAGKPRIEPKLHRHRARGDCYLRGPTFLCERKACKLKPGQAGKDSAAHSTQAASRLWTYGRCAGAHRHGPWTTLTR